jgi:hypothetical protein
LGLAEKRELGQLKSRVGIIALALSRIRIGRHRRPA